VNGGEVLFVAPPGLRRADAAVAVRNELDAPLISGREGENGCLRFQSLLKLFEGFGLCWGPGAYRARFGLHGRSSGDKDTQIAAAKA
jgi:hypothetical protein